MTNDETRMTKEIRMTNDEWLETDDFVIQTSSLIRHSDFGIRDFFWRVLAGSRRIES